MLRFSCKKWREALRDGIAQRKKSNKRGGNREESVPLECGVDQIHAEGAETDPEDVLPLVAHHPTPTVAAGRERVDQDRCKEEHQISNPERRIEGSKVRIQDGEEVLPRPTKHLVLTR